MNKCPRVQLTLIIRVLFIWTEYNLIMNIDIENIAK